jgi:hypothetical protein
MKDIKIISIAVGFSLLFSLFGAVFAYNYLPMEPIFLVSGGEENLGATITNINGSDTIKDSRAVINTNFANLNKDKTEYSSTTLKMVTSIPNLATVGTITSGTWSGTTLTVAKGGTGSSTLMSNWVLLGNGTTAIKGVPPGSDGNVLTLSSGVPTWGSGAIDQSLDYNWTGNHHFRTGTTTLHGFTVAQDLLIASGTLTQTPTADYDIVNKAYSDDSTACYIGQNSVAKNYTGNTTLAHSLGYTPGNMVFNGFTLQDSGANDGLSLSWGVATSTTGQQYQSAFSPTDNANDQVSGWGFVIYYVEDTGGLEANAKIIWNSATSTILDWVENDNDAGSGIRYFQYQLCK